MKRTLKIQTGIEAGFVFFENMGRSERFRRSNVEMCREAKAARKG
jgi:hypothetical protein